MTFNCEELVESASVTKERIHRECAMNTGKIEFKQVEIHGPIGEGDIPATRMISRKDLERIYPIDIPSYAKDIERLKTLNAMTEYQIELMNTDPDTLIKFFKNK